MDADDFEEASGDSVDIDEETAPRLYRQCFQADWEPPEDGEPAVPPAQQAFPGNPSEFRYMADDQFWGMPHEPIAQDPYTYRMYTLCGMERQWRQPDVEQSDQGASTSQAQPGRGRRERGHRG